MSVTEETEDGTRMSVGSAFPVESLWLNNYKVSLVGYVLYEPILQYTKP